MESRFWDRDKFRIAALSAAEDTVSWEEFGLGWGWKNRSSEFDAEDERRLDEAVVLVLASNIQLIYEIYSCGSDFDEDFILLTLRFGNRGNGYVVYALRWEG
jgi:hypothetical protein